MRPQFNGAVQLPNTALPPPSINPAVDQFGNPMMPPMNAFMAMAPPQHMANQGRTHVFGILLFFFSLFFQA